jgi:hypothetical protein
LFGIHPRQGCLGGSLHAEVVEPLALRQKIVGDVPEALSSGKLAGQHGEELAPAVVGPKFLPGMVHVGGRCHISGQMKAVASARYRYRPWLGSP